MNFKKMNPTVKAAWLKALRLPNTEPGHYQQTAGTLCRLDGEGLGATLVGSPNAVWASRVLVGDHFCCLGVLTNLAVIGREECAIESARPWLYASMPTEAVMEWAGLSGDAAATLAEKNDFGASFATIADWVDINL